MRISGAGRLSGGKIDEELHTSGSTRISGNFECNGFKSSGSFRGSGNLIVHGDLSSSGSFRLGGSIYGDGDAGSSGSTRIGGELSILGYLKSSGSLRVGNHIKALEGIKFSGSSVVRGNVFSERGILLSGSTTIHGDVNGAVIDIGVGRGLGSRGAFKHPVKIYGNVFASKSVNLVRALVQGDVKGRHVIIGRNSEILGKVYYVDDIQINERCRLNHDPIQISAEELGVTRNMNKKDLEQDKYLHCPNCANKINLSNKDLKFCEVCGFNIEQVLIERGLK
jgi:cytoskeletal protein CcmA (bactofilin family)